MYQEVSMLPPKKSRQVLLKMFRKKYIANLDELFDVLETHSRMSVFRRLKSLGIYQVSPMPAATTLYKIYQSSTYLDCGSIEMLAFRVPAR